MSQKKEFVTRGGPFAEWKNEGEELEILAREAQQGHQGPWHPLCPDEDPTKRPNLEFEQVISEVTLCKQTQPRVVCSAKFEEDVDVGFDEKS